jgi:hypothetical protein
MRLVVSFGTTASLENQSSATTIELTLPTDKGERLISAVRIASASDMQSVMDIGKLTFQGVPTQLPIWLRMSVRSKDGAILCTYGRSYVLRFPERTRTAKIGLARALEESGYLGDFVVDPVGAEIARRVTSQQGR